MNRDWFDGEGDGEAEGEEEAKAASVKESWEDDSDEENAESIPEKTNHESVTSVSPTDGDPSKFLRLVLLVWHHGTAAARKSLQNLYEGQNKISLHEWLNSKRDRIYQHVQRPGNKSRQTPLNQRQWDVLFPPSAKRKRKVKLNDLDLTLVTYLLRKFFEEPQAVWVIRENRNGLAHANDTSLTDEEFERVWTEVTNAIRQLNPEAHLNSLKEGKLDTKAAQDSLEKLQRQYKLEEEMKFLQNEVKEIKETVDCVKEKVHGVKERVDCVENSVDCVTNNVMENNDNIATLRRQVDVLELKQKRDQSSPLSEDTHKRRTSVENSDFFDFGTRQLNAEDINSILNEEIPCRSIIVYKTVPDIDALVVDVLSTEPMEHA